MKFNLPAFEQKLKIALSLFDKKSVVELCGQLMEFLNSSNATLTTEEIKKLENVLQALRNKRMFALMQRVADCCIQTGRQTYKIRRQYAQSLIDQEIFTGALSVLNELKNDTANDAAETAAAENKEAMGLIGRVYKQLYVNADKPGNPRFSVLLKQSLQHYQSVYSLSPENSLWHGINLVALLRRAEKDKLRLNGFPDAAKVAKEILALVEEKDSNGKADTWDFATAIEACTALNKPAEALAWTNRYVHAPYTDAFELGSTSRQLKEVWQLDENKGIGKQVLPLLQAALLKREGTNILLDTEGFQKQQKEDSSYGKNLERVFGTESFKTFDWYMKGKDRCMPVARIGKDKSKGSGTGFLLKGELLHKKLKGEMVLLTNAHVASTRPNENAQGALLPEEVVVIFETIDSKTELRVKEIFWSSPIKKYDVSILRFDEQSKKKVKEFAQSMNMYTIAKTLPATDGQQRVYIIGHPAGGTLQISLQDNVFLAQKDPLLHYRTPTVGGSSGSPVFNDNWDLIAIHHAGSPVMKKLDRSGGVYEANEGIAIQRIIKELNKEVR
jgi:V8-like Glu-specific endopeptidase